MKVLMIAPQPFLEPRGTPISVYQRVRGLALLGHSVDLVVYYLGQNVDLPGVTIHRIPAIPWIRELKVGRSLAKIPLDFLVFWKAVGLLLRNCYDVIHTHEEAAFFAILLSAVFRIPHLYDMHSSLPQQLVAFRYGNIRPIIWLFSWLERLAVRTAHAMITIDADLERYVFRIRPDVRLEMIENLPMRTVHHPPGTCPAYATPAELRRRLGLEGRTVVVYAGTFEIYQGLNLLLDSIEIVTQQSPKTVFLLIGGKSRQVKQYRQEAARRGLKDVVHFLGTLPVDETHPYLEMADILVSPRVQGTSVPLKIYTYLHLGKPVVATRLPAHTLVLDDTTAILVEPQAEAFAQGLLALIQEPGLRSRLGQQGQALAREKFDTTSYLEKLDRVYQTLQADFPPIEQPASAMKKAGGD